MFIFGVAFPSAMFHLFRSNRNTHANHVISSPVSSGVAAWSRDMASQQLLTLSQGQEISIDFSSPSSSSSDLCLCCVARSHQHVQTSPLQQLALLSWLKAGAKKIIILKPKLAEKDEEEEKVYKMLASLFSGVELMFSWSVGHGQGGVPYVNSMIEQCDVQCTTSDHIVMLSSDAMMLPSFLTAWNALIKQCLKKNDDPYLLTGPRVLYRWDNQEQAKKIIQDGEMSMRRAWLKTASRPNPHSMDFFGWRKGQWANEPIPDFLVGRGIWEFWVWSHAMRKRWAMIQGGNVLFTLHPVHMKPGDQPEEYVWNSEQARKAVRNNMGTLCNRMQCAELFLYKGLCRENDAISTADDQKSTFCLRRKEPGWEPSDAKDDHKIPLSLTYY